jgi:Zn-dependent protease
MQVTESIFYVAVLIMSVVVHEVAHGYAASRLGDQTAVMAGRLTLNPLKHLDFIGSFLLPLLLIISKAGFVFGWARPVPYNPNNLRDKKWGTVIVASAGIIANAGMVVIFSLMLRLLPVVGVTSPALMSILAIIVLVNIVLMIFNLIPIPPLDGSKILFAFLPSSARRIEYYMEQYSLVVLLFFVIFLWRYIAPYIYILFNAVTGLS